MPTPHGPIGDQVDPMPGLPLRPRCGGPVGKPPRSRQFLAAGPAQAGRPASTGSFRWNVRPLSGGQEQVGADGTAGPRSRCSTVTPSHCVTVSVVAVRTGGSRGPYRKGIERRQEIIAAAADLFAESGYRNFSVRELARRLNITQPGVLHHFSDKDELLIEVLKLRDTIVSDHLDSLADVDLPTRSRAVASQSADNEGLTSLFIRLSAEAIDVDHPAHAYFKRHYALAGDVARRLQRTDAPTWQHLDIDPDVIATLERAIQDGLQLQRRYRDDLEVGKTIDAFWRLVSAACRAAH